MDDTPKPPPLPPQPLSMSLARARQRRERELAALLEQRERELAACQRALQGERDLVDMLRSQLVVQRDPGEEDTVPGLGVTPKARTLPPASRRARGRMRARKWALLAVLLLGALAEAASVRYPQLVGPITALQHAFQSWEAP